MNKNKIIYSPKYDLLPNGFGVLHPFDVRKYSRAWGELTRLHSSKVRESWFEPKQVIAYEKLINVHTEQYLKSLDRSDVIAGIIEVHLARYLPQKFLNRYILEPMKYACEGTRLATQYALEGAMVMNMGGGYHHAFADHGEGFCVFADVAVAITDARSQGLLASNDNVLMIDLDAHRGNGFNSIASQDEAVKIFDMYNFQVYPGMAEGDMDDFPFLIPLKRQINDDTYLQILKEELPKFIGTVTRPKLVFYNAGTDILAGDRLGDLNVSYRGVVERDCFVIELLKELGVPTVILTSGGYTNQSYKLVANQAAMLL
jgi:histone deacetylase 11